MKVIVFIIFLLIPVTCVKADGYDQALKVTQKAILTLPVVKIYKKNLEKALTRALPIEKDTVAILGSVLNIGLTRQISTDAFKNLSFRAFSGRIKPELTHDFIEKKSNVKINMQWSY